MNSTRGLCGSVVGILMAVFVLPPPCPGQGEQLWEVTSGGQWGTRKVSLGDHGGQVFTPPGDYDDHYWLHSAFDGSFPAPVLAEAVPGHPYWPKVASSDRADVHVGVYQRPLPGEPWVREAVVSKFDSGQDTALWTYVSPARIHDHPWADVAVSDDGATIVFVVRDEDWVTGMTVLDPANGCPVSVMDVDIFGYYVDFLLSGDGSTALLVSYDEMVLVDIATMAKIHGNFLPNGINVRSWAISYNGDRIAYGSINEYRVYDRQADNSYTQIFATGYLGPGYIKGIDISDDGSRVSSALWDGNAGKRIRIGVREIDTDTILMEDVISYSGEYANAVAKLSMDSSGNRFAVGLWGDEFGETPELLVYDSTRSDPIFTYDLPGSVLDLDLAPGGQRLAVVSVDQHVDTHGGDNRIDLFQIGNPGLTLNGVPRSGDTVTFQQPNRTTGVPALVLCSSDLAEIPAVFPGAGTLYLDRARMFKLRTGTQDPGSGEMKTPFTIHGAPGTTLYFQGMNVGERKLSENFIKMTVLP